MTLPLTALEIHTSVYHIRTMRKPSSTLSPCVHASVTNSQISKLLGIYVYSMLMFTDTYIGPGIMIEFLMVSHICFCCNCDIGPLRCSSSNEIVTSASVVLSIYSLAIRLAMRNSATTQIGESQMLSGPI